MRPPSTGSGESDDGDEVPIEKLMAALPPQAVRVGEEAVDEALAAMEMANKVMFREGVVHLI